MQKEVDAGNARGRKVFFLTIELSPQCSDVAASFAYMVNGFEQHTTSAAGGIVDGFAFLWIKDTNHQADNTARRVEFTSFLVGGVGKFLDEIFIGLTEYIGVDIAI